MYALAPASPGDVVRRLHAAVNRRDADAVAALCRDDVVREDPAAPYTLRGRDAKCMWMQRMAAFRARARIPR